MREIKYWMYGNCYSVGRIRGQDVATNSVHNIPATFNADHREFYYFRSLRFEDYAIREALKSPVQHDGGQRQFHPYSIIANQGQ